MKEAKVCRTKYCIKEAKKDLQAEEINTIATRKTIITSIETQTYKGLSSMNKNKKENT